VEGLELDRRRALQEPRPRGLLAYVAVTPDGAVVVGPVRPEDTRADRGQRLAVTLAAALAQAADLPPPRDGRDLSLEAGRWQGFLAMRVSTPDGAAAVELYELALAEQATALDRLEPVAVVVPEGTLDDTEPLAAPWLWRAEVAARVGGRPAGRLPPELEDALTGYAATREPEEAAQATALAHDDPRPRRRVVRRILRRLDGMGKYGGYHTEFSHLARGFAGHDRALALAAGEVLLRAGLLDEKPSVGQRHVFLVTARSADIRRLVDSGETDDPVIGAFFAADEPGTGQLQ
jgi:hypothetical protein